LEHLEDNYLGDLGIDGRIILKLISNKYGLRSADWSHLFWRVLWQTDVNTAQ
jgi:hypothetical protein